MSMSDLLTLERRYSIDESYMVGAQLDPHFDQTRAGTISFQNVMLDPDFACVVIHDGREVVDVNLLGFEPRQ